MVPVVRVLAVGHPLPDRCVPENLRFVLMPLFHIATDDFPAQAVGGSGNPRHEPQTLLARFDRRRIQQQELSFGIAAINIQSEPGTGAVIGIDDVGGLVFLVGDTPLAHGTLPCERIGGFGVAQHLAGAVGIAAERLGVPHLELAVIGVIQRGGNKRIERGLFPRQATVLQQ